MEARSKAWIWGRSLFGTVVSIPIGGGGALVSSLDFYFPNDGLLCGTPLKKSVNSSPGKKKKKKPPPPPPDCRRRKLKPVSKVA